ncbi:MAG TPA: histidinol dehydrogenase [Solirubrobacteraceae bacterium]|jgi:histidinol dehydrogenase|nr:histidinol dehydrogenase [Solirubrobacteraceae bacterium]
MLVERVTLAEADAGAPALAAAHLRRLVGGVEGVEEAVATIVAHVRAEGDEAVNEYTRRFDTDGVEPREICVAPGELDQALEAMPLEVVAGLQVAIANVASVADASIGSERVIVELPQGHTVTLREMPVGAAAIYTPGGRAAYPSTVVMGVVTARAAGVLDVAVCTPPGPDGQAHPAILAACRLCGVERVYRMGGAQAVAALAFGTESVGRADVIVGPGNLYVQEAKRRLSHVVGIDGFAGPSDLMVVFGSDADPRLVALDLLAQAEHGAGSLVAGLSSSRGALDAVGAAIEHELAGAPESELEPDACVLIETATPLAAVDLANEFAPEHLQLVGAAEELLAPKVRTAGCLLLGRNGATAFGDYTAGSNHVLPTGGAARFASALSPRHFRRRMSIVEIPDPAAAKLAKAGAPLAEVEGFPLHARSMRARAPEGPRR